MTVLQESYFIVELHSDGDQRLFAYGSGPGQMSLGWWNDSEIEGGFSRLEGHRGYFNYDSHAAAIMDVQNHYRLAGYDDNQLYGTDTAPSPQNLETTIDIMHRAEQGGAEIQSEVYAAEDLHTVFSILREIQDRIGENDIGRGDDLTDDQQAEILARIDRHLNPAPQPYGVEPATPQPHHGGGAPGAGQGNIEHTPFPVPGQDA